MDRLTKDNLLRRIDETAIFSYYFNGNIVIKSNIYTSPFRPDRSIGSCHFAYDSRGKLRFHDKAMGESYDCFDFVMSLYNCSFYEAMRIINCDFNIHLFDNNKVPTFATNPIKPFELTSVSIPDKPPVKFDITYRKWNINDGSYWRDRYGISCKTLIDYGVRPVDKYYVNQLGPAWSLDYEYETTDPCYAYIIEGSNGLSIKLYRPLTSDKKKKWKSTIDPGVVYGYNMLPVQASELYIVSSLKDGLCLSQTNKHFVAGCSETCRIPKEKIQELKTRFSKIIYLLDNDNTGINWCKKMALENKVYYAILPEIDQCKDIADIREKCGLNALKSIINNTKPILWDTQVKELEQDQLRISA